MKNLCNIVKVPKYSNYKKCIREKVNSSIKFPESIKISVASNPTASPFLMSTSEDSIDEEAMWMRRTGWIMDNFTKDHWPLALWDLLCGQSDPPICLSHDNMQIVSIWSKCGNLIKKQHMFSSKQLRYPTVSVRIL